MTAPSHVKFLCNNCYSDEGVIYLRNCGHIFCKRCASYQACKFCNVTSTVAQASSTPELQDYLVSFDIIRGRRMEKELMLLRFIELQHGVMHTLYKKINKKYEALKREAHQCIAKDRKLKTYFQKRHRYYEYLKQKERQMFGVQYESPPGHLAGRSHLPSIHETASTGGSLRSVAPVSYSGLRSLFNESGGSYGSSPGTVEPLTTGVQRMTFDPSGSSRATTPRQTHQMNIRNAMYNIAGSRSGSSVIANPPTAGVRDYMTSNRYGSDSSSSQRRSSSQHQQFYYNR